MTNDLYIDLAGWDNVQLLQNALNVITDPFFVKNRNHQWLAFNQAFADMLGQSPEALLGKSDFDFLPAAQAQSFWQDDDKIFNTGEVHKTEEQIDHADGTVHTLWTRKFPLRDATGDIIGLVAIITDITDLHQRREEVMLLERQVHEQMAVIAEQNSLLDVIGVPIIEVSEGVVLLPLVGNIDAHRAQRVMESMLGAVTTHHASHVILDISGVPVVDTNVAGSLMRAVRASRLLGCETIIVGISPEIAQTLVQLGLDFETITTHASLKQGLTSLIEGKNGSSGLRYAQRSA